MTYQALKPVEIRILPDGRMDTENASRYTGLSKKTLAMMRSRGTGPKFIKRGRIFYFSQDLDAWLNEGGRVSSTAQIRARVAKVVYPKLATQSPGIDHAVH